MSLRPFLLSICLLVSNFIFAEARASQDFKVRYIGIEMGLSNNAVTGIYQDKRGFMWIGTYDGLNRYDGYNFFVYRNQPNDTTTLVNNRIVSIYENAAGIWVGTKKGLSVYNFQSGAFESRTLLDHTLGKQVKINFNINQIKGDTDRLFLATAGKGLLIQKDQQPLFNQLPLKIDSRLIWDYHAQGIDFDREGNLWVFVQGYGLFKLANQSDDLEFVSAVTNNANSIITDRHSRIWLGMDSGLLMYSAESNTHKFFSRELTGHKVTGLMYLKEEDEIWASTDGSGVFIYDNETGDFSSLKEGPEETNITSNSVYALYQDNKGEKWIGTLRGGVNVVEKENVQFKTIRKTREKIVW
ncbi:two-component regulator propeller domain-containing protein [Algoriphagus sp. Y33]|uniref:ligand-binding sensor domain-containing protein n=1 Tax=Algoriphagus sp. Y33 TaxID=2772483 RepID=UPI00177F79C2|nr:two-component regulator propeller domain-containing protein [Algoriphagus sp. Y33]